MSAGFLKNERECGEGVELLDRATPPRRRDPPPPVQPHGNRPARAPTPCRGARHERLPTAAAPAPGSPQTPGPGSLRASDHPWPASRCRRSPAAALPAQLEPHGTGGRRQARGKRQSERPIRGDSAAASPGVAVLAVSPIAAFCQSRQSTRGAAAGVMSSTSIARRVTRGTSERPSSRAIWWCKRFL